MKAVLWLMALLGLVQAGAAQPPIVTGHVRLSAGQPVAGAQVALFDLTDLRRGPVARATTDAAGAFALSGLGGRALPDGFALGQNYPNPFNPSTLIPYQLPVATHVRLEVFNVLGQRVATLVDGERPAGFHTAAWDATNAAGQAVGAGLYIYRLSGGGALLTRKMMLLDGQAGVAAVPGGSGRPMVERPLGQGTPVYGLAVWGTGLAAYVDPAFGVKAGMAPVEVVVAAPARAKRLQEEDRLLGDIDRNGHVNMVDAILLAFLLGAFLEDPSGLEEFAADSGYDIDLGDVNGDGVVDIIDAALIGAYNVNPYDPMLPAGIGERVGGTSGATNVTMYWTDLATAKIQRANLNDRQVEDLVTTDLEMPTGLALDVGGGKMYWTDPERFMIQRANLDGSQVEDLVTGIIWQELRSPVTWEPPDSFGSLLTFGFRFRSPFDPDPATITMIPFGLALDAGGGKMYWTDYTSKIRRANLYGGQAEILVTTDLETPTGLALDVGGGKMYWTDNGTNKIQRANLDGRQVEDLVTGLETSFGLALDVGGGKMYWTDSGTNKIQRANLDGRQVEDLVTGLETPSSLALDVGGGKMYWTDSGTNKIQRANLDGRQVEDLVTGLETPSSLALDTSGSGSGGGAALRGDDHSDTRSGATSLSVGSSLAGRIATRDDVDYFEVEVSEVGVLTVYTTGSLGTKGTLENRDGARLEFSSGSGGNFRIERTVRAGTYYVKVEGVGSNTGDYIVHAHVLFEGDDHSDTRSGATSLPVGSSLAGRIATGDDVDYFKVEVRQAGVLTVYTTGRLDTEGRLEDSDGARLEWDTRDGSGENFRIERTVSAGTYYVKVEGVGSNTGDYIVHAHVLFEGDDHSDTRSGATSLPVGSSLAGRIATRDDVDYFEVEVSEVGVLTVYTTGSLGTKGTLENRDGARLEFSSGSGGNFRIERTVRAGTYYVKVEGVGSNTGDYTVHARFRGGE